MEPGRHRVRAFLSVLILLVAAGCGSSAPVKGDPCAGAALDCGPHGGCADVGGAATCVCDPGHAGARCEACAAGYQDNDRDGVCALDCASAGLDCSGHGTCTDGGGTARCECTTGFTGVSCDACLPGRFGGECQACTCVRGTCDDGIAGDGACTCPAPFAGPSCDQCPAAAASAIYLFNVGPTSVDAMQGSRDGIDALAQAALPSALPTTGATVHLAHGFISKTDDAIRDFPTSLCVPSGVPVLGVGAGGALTRLADDWADFMDGTIATTIGAALGFQDFNYFWTGSHADGSASTHDCSGWTVSTGDDATISRRANVTTDWLEETGGALASCGSQYFMLGLARCISGCPP